MDRVRRRDGFPGGGASRLLVFWDVGRQRCGPPATRLLTWNGRGGSAPTVGRRRGRERLGDGIGVGPQRVHERGRTGLRGLSDPCRGRRTPRLRGLLQATPRTGRRVAAPARPDAAAAGSAAGSIAVWAWGAG